MTLMFSRLKRFPILFIEFPGHLGCACWTSNYIMIFPVSYCVRSKQISKATLQYVRKRNVKPKIVLRERSRCVSSFGLFCFVSRRCESTMITLLRSYTLYLSRVPDMSTNIYQCKPSMRIDKTCNCCCKARINTTTIRY